jgi:hypothetical protein
MVTLMFIFGPLGAMALGLLVFIALARIARDADEWVQEHRDEQAEKLDEWYPLPSSEGRAQRSVR